MLTYQEDTKNGKIIKEKTKWWTRRDSLCHFSLFARILAKLKGLSTPVGSQSLRSWASSCEPFVLVHLFIVCNNEGYWTRYVLISKLVDDIFAHMQEFQYRWGFLWDFNKLNLDF